MALQSDVAPGSGGLRNEFLVALGERMSDEEDLGLAYTGPELPEWQGYINFMFSVTRVTG